MQPEQLGPYRIQRCLGQGGMGTVYEGFNDETGRTAAVKVLSPGLAAHPNFRERFATEIETLKKLRHPNIVELYGYGEQQGQLFYAMELVDGRTLQEELQAGRRFSWQEVTRFAIQVSTALKHAHDRGVIHRDLKPANLMVTSDQQIKLADFGIAKLFGAAQVTAEGGVIGTANFMSPEQAEGRPVTARSDLFSLGSVMFALLTRRPPFVARSVPEVLHALRYEEPPLLSRLAPDVPDELSRIVMQLLEKDPAERIATALAVSKRLKAMVFGLEQQTRVADVAPPVPLPEDPAASPQVLLPGDQPHSRQTVAASPSDIQRLKRHADATLDAAEAVSDYELQSHPQEASLGENAPTHFTLVNEEERRRAEFVMDLEQDTTPTWQKLLMLLAAAAVVAVALWFGLRPASADRLYQRIQAAAESEDPGQLEDARDVVTQFLERFPEDPRREEVTGYQRDVELYQLQRRLERRAKRLAGSESLEPAERAYLDVLRLMNSDPTAALPKLQAFVQLYGDDPSASRATRACVELARAEMANLSQRVQVLRATGNAALRRQIERATAMRSSDPEQARAICQGLISLYHDKAWAQPFVEQAQQLLEDLPESLPR